MEKALKTRYHDAMTKLRPQNKELDLLVVILPDNNGSLYGSNRLYVVKFQLFTLIII